MTIHRTSNGTWAYCFEYGSKRYKRRFKSRDKAANAEANLRKELMSGFENDRSMTFREASALFFEKHSKPNKATYAEDEKKIELLNGIFGDKRLVDFTPLDIQNLRSYLPGIGTGRKRITSSATVDKYHGLVKAIFSKMYFWRMFAGYNPATGVRLKREFKPHVRWLAREEIGRLEEVLPESIYPYYLCALHTGMRKNEILGLKWNDITFSIRDIYAIKTKSCKPRHIPMNDTLYRFLMKRYGEGKKPEDPVFGQLSGDYLSHGFRKACQKAGVKDFRFHDLRHTFASHLVMSGVNIYQVSKWLGHSSVTTTEKYYAHFSQDCKREEIEKLNKLNEWAAGSPKSHPIPEIDVDSKNSENTKVIVNAALYK